MSLGQILFVVLTLMASSLMFFYLGAKFGPQVLKLSESRGRLEDAFLPDDKLALEIKDILAKGKTDFTFFDVVQNKKSFPSVKVVKNSVEKLSLIKDEKKTKSLPKLEEKPTKPKVKTRAFAKKEEPKKQRKPKQVLKKTTLNPKKKLKTPKESKPKALAQLQKTPEQEIKEEVKKTRYLLQVGSFSSLKKAEKQQRVWSDRGFAPQIVVAQIPGKGKWYRLRLGLYQDYDSIQNQQKRIMQKYKQTAMILPIQ